MPRNKGVEINDVLYKNAEIELRKDLTCYKVYLYRFLYETRCSGEPVCRLIDRLQSRHLLIDENGKTHLLSNPLLKSKSYEIDKIRYDLPNKNIDFFKSICTKNLTESRISLTLLARSYYQIEKANKTDVDNFVKEFEGLAKRRFDENDELFVFLPTAKQLLDKCNSIYCELNDTTTAPFKNHHIQTYKMKLKKQSPEYRFRLKEQRLKALYEERGNTYSVAQQLSVELGRQVSHSTVNHYMNYYNISYNKKLAEGCMVGYLKVTKANVVFNYDNPSHELQCTVCGTKVQKSQPILSCARKRELDKDDGYKTSCGCMTKIEGKKCDKNSGKALLSNAVLLVRQSDDTLLDNIKLKYYFKGHELFNALYGGLSEEWSENKIRFMYDELVKLYDNVLVIAIGKGSLFTVRALSSSDIKNAVFLFPEFNADKKEGSLENNDKELSWKAKTHILMSSDSSIFDGGISNFMSKNFCTLTKFSTEDKKLYYSWLRDKL